MIHLKRSILILSVVLACQNQAFCKQILTVINRSSSNISAIFLSDSNTSDWEENLLPDGYVLPYGNQIDITILPRYKRFDLRVESTDGGAEDYMEFPGSTTVTQLNGRGEVEYE